MIKTRKCPKCNEYYDETLPECPTCHEKNDTFVNDAKAQAKRDVTLPLGRQLLAFVAGWLGLDILATLISLIIQVILLIVYDDPAEVDLAMQTLQIAMFINFFAYVALFGILGIIAWPIAKKFVNQFKKFRPLLLGISYGVGIIVAGTLIGILYQLLGITPTDNANESAVVAMMKAYPVMSFVAFVILGPVCEEITYRLGLFSGIKRYSKLAAYVVVILLFGLIHFDFQTTNWTNELLNLPYYMSAGAILCFVYDQEDLATSMYAHVTNNLVSYVSTYLFSTNVLTKIL